MFQSYNLVNVLESMMNKMYRKLVHVLRRGTFHRNLEKNIKVFCDDVLDGAFGFYSCVKKPHTLSKK